MIINFYRSESDPVPARAADCSLEDLRSLFERAGAARHACEPGLVGKPPTRVECVRKYGPCWSPVVAEHRKNSDVEAVTALVLDLDHLPRSQVAGALRRLETYRYLAHTTHSHERPDDCCLRVVVELDAPVPAARFREFRAAAVALLGVPCDPQCKDLSRMYFLPSVPEGREFLLDLHPGAPLATDLAPLPAASPSSIMLPDAPPASRAGDVGEVERAAASVIQSKSRTQPSDPEKLAADRGLAAALGRMVNGYAFAGPGERDATLLRCMGALAHACDEPWDAVREWARESLAATPSDSGRDWSEEARDMFERARAHKKELAAKRAERAAAVDSWLEATREPLAPLAEGADEGDWRKFLIIDDEGGVRSCGHNAAIILTHAPESRGLLRFDVVAKRVEFTGGRFADVNPNSVHAAVGNWLQSAWGVFLRSGEVKDQVSFVARRNPHDPIAAYLGGLTWDGQVRLDTWLEVYCGAALVNEHGDDVTSVVRQFARKWFVGATARALRPGCKLDTVLVLEGLQGARKSSAFEALMSPWYSGDRVNMGDKDSKMAAARSWGVELAEMVSIKRGDEDMYKQFLSQSRDVYRPPYGDQVEEFPRRAVFVGSWNPRPGGYLTDQTGNRRYWPVTCTGDVDAAGLARDRDQLWAEAVAHLAAMGACPECQADAYRGCASHRWWFERSEQAAVEEMVTDERVQQSSALEEEVRRRWHQLTSKPPYLTIRQVAVDWLQVPAERVDRGLEMKVGQALVLAGFKRRRASTGARGYVYVPYKVMPPPGDRPALRSVPDEVADARPKRSE